MQYDVVKRYDSKRNVWRRENKFDDWILVQVFNTTQEAFTWVATQREKVRHARTRKGS